MPIFEFQAPDGKTYEIEAPEGATQEQAFEVLQQQLAGGPPPAPAPTAPGGGLVAPSSGVPGDPGTGGATPPPAAPPGARPGFVPMTPEEFESAKLEEQQRVKDEMMASMGMGERLAAGAGQATAGTIRGVRQLWNMATGDEEELARLTAEEEESRILDEPLLSTGAGRFGQIGGHVLQALLPAGAVAKGAKAANLGLKGTIAAESALGAGIGAAQPTARGESHKTNATTGAIIGALFPGGGAAIDALKRAPGAVLTRALHAVAPRGTRGLIDAAGATLRTGSDKVRKTAGEEIGRLVEPVRVQMGRQLASKLRSVRHDYSDSLPKDVSRKLDDWISLASGGGKAAVKGSAVQEARTAIAREAAESQGVRQTGLQRLYRVLDEALLGSMPKAQAKALKKAQDAYRTGQRAGHVEGGSLRRASGRGAVQGVRSGSMPVYQQDDK